MGVRGGDPTAGTGAHYFRYWGKAQAKPEGGAAFHLLPYHCLDVTSVADAWWRRSGILRHAFTRATGLDQARTRAWVLFFVALHDLGKFDVRFQRKAPDVALALWPGFAEAFSDDRYTHGPAGLHWFDKACRAADRDDIYLDAVGPWMEAVAGHHGELTHYDPGTPNADDEVIAHDAAARAAWIETLQALFLKPAGIESGATPPPSPALLAGFCSVCDWLGSNEDYFGYVSDPIVPLAAYPGRREKAARKVLEDSGLLGHRRAPGGMGAVFPDRSPRGVRTLVDAWPVHPGLTLIEAPTGSGKTEAALAYASRLLAGGRAEGIVFALPTQATANAMLERLEEAAPRRFFGTANVVLAHGKARYQPAFIDLRTAAEPRSAQREEEAQVQCARWLAVSRKRALLGQVGVCTIDQVLLSVLPVRHQFVRAFGIGKSVLIVDEVHAYDSYMSGLLHQVLTDQRKAGGSAILLSATLAEGQRRRLLEAWGTSAASDLSVYPLVTHADADGVLPFELPASERSKIKPRTVPCPLWPAPRTLPTDEHVERIAEAAASGAAVAVAVAVVCNLVADAQAIARRLRKVRPAPVDLFHARYRFRDRQEIERQVLPFGSTWR